jgi:hypothetical protein
MTVPGDHSPERLTLRRVGRLSFYFRRKVISASKPRTAAAFEIVRHEALCPGCSRELTTCCATPRRSASSDCVTSAASRSARIACALSLKVERSLAVAVFGIEGVAPVGCASLGAV